MFNQPISTSSLESEALPLQHAGQASALSASLKRSRTPAECLSDTGPTFPMSEMCETRLESGRDSSQVDFLANHSVSPGTAAARQMTVSSGRRCEMLLKRQGPLQFLLRTFLASLVWHSTECFLTWKPSATPAGRLLFLLAPSMPNTGESECGLLALTPNAAAFKGGRTIPRKGVKNPERNNYQDMCSLTLGMRYPLPEFGESLMGYPLGWTLPEIEPLETLSSRKSRIKSSKPSVECCDGKTVSDRRKGLKPLGNPNPDVALL